MRAPNSKSVVKLSAGTWTSKFLAGQIEQLQNDKDDFETCRIGLPRIAMQAQQGLANSTVGVDLSTITLSRCVDAGIGWRAGNRGTADESLFSLSVGDGRL